MKNPIDLQVDVLEGGDLPRDTFLNLPVEKRRRVEEAALREFAEKGYQKASIQAIARAAGVAKGSMYQYFKGKDQLFLYIFSLAIKNKIQYVLRVLQEHWGLPFFQLLEELFVSGQHYARVFPYTYQIYLKSKEGLPPEIRDKISRQLDSSSTAQYYEALVEEAAGRGEIREDIDLGLAVFVVFTLMKEFGAYMVAAPPLSEEENKLQVLQFVDVLKNGLRGGACP